MTVRARLTSPAGARVLALAVALGSLAAVASRAALAGPPAPLTPSLFAFPGATVGPASAASAGLALADRWLGDEPFSNPAVAPGLRVILSPALVRVSRQDLRADNRNVDETPAFFDGAGAALGLPGLGPLGFALYAFQPVLRLEDNAFTRGRAALDPGITPATVQSHSSARELRAGLAIAARLGAARVGLGAEWTRRQDRYETIEQSGDPQTAGKDSLAFSGDGLGLQGGLRWDRGDSTAGSFTVGAGVRYVPELELKGTGRQVRALGTTDVTLRARRSSGWEAGVSGRCVVWPVFRVLGAVGVRTAQRWEGFDVVAGRAWEWKLAGEYHDAGTPWTLRLGLGQERQSDVPEPRANVMSLGLGWELDGAIVDAGFVRRTLARESKPRSFEDRVVVSVRVPR